MRVAIRLLAALLAVASVGCGERVSEGSSAATVTAAATATGARSWSTAREAACYATVVRWAARRPSPAAAKVSIAGSRGGPNGERTAIPYSKALREAIVERLRGRPAVTFGAPPSSDLPRLSLSTFAIAADGQGRARVARYDLGERTWERDVTVQSRRQRCTVTRTGAT